MAKKRPPESDPLARFHPATQAWFRGAFDAPTPAQAKGFPPILEGASTLLLAPTGSGKTLAAFLAAIDRLMASPEPEPAERCRVVYVSPLKALAIDVERNLRAPLAGIAAAAERLGLPYRVPQVGVRSGDTAPEDRARLAKKPPDILITTPESLYLLLTANARDRLRHVETVIVDEIHALVATKRGAHLALSLERLEALRQAPRPLQRIGLSATQRPLDEVARMLGGGEIEGAGAGARFAPRPVTIVDASAPKALELRIEVPVEDMARLGERAGAGEGPPPAPADPAQRSIWPSIHPRLVELVRAHRTTMIFVNSRRLAERLAAALNDTAGAEIALAHHGSIAREQRQQIEERLKAGLLPCIVATSSLELGLDLGAVDLVIQLEAPPSVAAGLQRVGRAGHEVGGTSRGIVFPKHRGDLLACAAAASRMREGKVEATLYPRNPLDVLAQQIVAIASMDTLHVDALFSLVRGAAPFADLPRASFEGVLDMLSGRYPSDEFAELRPRVVWDRVGGAVRARKDAKRLAVVNAGTIPDRGLYGVFLDTGGDAARPGRRVGELDEEMVFEAREGEVFLLGASSWRITDITHDRVLVVPAPGEPGKMPFWRGDQAGRNAELGASIGALARRVASLSDDEAERALADELGLDARAAQNLVRYVRDQAAATGEVPSDRAIVLERFVDEVGDYRICLLSPFGGRVHAPLSTCIAEKCRLELGLAVDTVWTDDGIVLRLPESESPPDAKQLLPQADEVEDLLVRGLGDTALFASRFRECAGRALLLPRKFPGKRSPLWAQRKRAADLLAVASRYGSFPILLETYRECLRDVFDLTALEDLLRQIAARKVRVVTVDVRAPSPFAATLLFAYAGNFIYEGDLPLAERRAQVLAIDHARLRELLGEAELRELFDADAVAALEASLQRLDGRAPLRNEDQVHDLLLSLGDLTRDEVARRAEGPDAPPEAARERADLWIDELARDRRVIEIQLGGERRLAAAEDAGRLRDAFGVVPPPGLPIAFLEPAADPLAELVARYARTHGPFRAEDVARRFGLGPAPVLAALARLAERGRVVEGEFLPGGRGREFCDAEVLRSLKRRSLARLRAEVEPVPPEAYARFLADWHGLHRRRRGLDGLLAALEQLQGAPLSASALEAEILPARVEGYRPGDLDALCAAGEVVWRGVEPVGDGDGRVALYLAEAYPYLAPPPGRAEGALAESIRAALARRGALFFSDLSRETGAFGLDLLGALWDLVWAGEVTNDTLAPLRALGREARPSGRRRERERPAPGGRGLSALRSRRIGPPGSEGRWSLLSPAGAAASAPGAAASAPGAAASAPGAAASAPGAAASAPGLAAGAPGETERRTALARALLERHGVLTREAAAVEGLAGGFSAVYDVLRAMEEAGQARRGYFIAGLGAAQFAVPGADDRLRACREPSDDPRTLVLAATDPASPWGAAVRWPEVAARADGAPEGAVRGPVRPQRAAGALVILHDGRLLAWMGRTERSLTTFLPEAEPERGEAIRAIASALAALVSEGRRRAVLVATIDGEPAHSSPLARALAEVGFTSGAHGYLNRAPTPERAPWRPRQAPANAPDWARRAAATGLDAPEDDVDGFKPPPGLRSWPAGSTAGGWRMSPPGAAAPRAADGGAPAVDGSLPDDLDLDDDDDPALFDDAAGLDDGSA
ncbi:DEAD/DEAH box helicase [Sorangium sp. So ce854]|uniref:DEAD/DEAH box helicase n=1 Tax=Sorangium sp. So ce854 TaxID=3133322 RepID=UPI003F638F66